MWLLAADDNWNYRNMHWEVIFRYLQVTLRSRAAKYHIECRETFQDSFENWSRKINRSSALNKQTRRKDEYFYHLKFKDYRSLERFISEESGVYLVDWLMWQWFGWCGCSLLSKSLKNHLNLGTDEIYLVCGISLMAWEMSSEKSFVFFEVQHLCYFYFEIENFINFISTNLIVNQIYNNLKYLKVFKNLGKKILTILKHFCRFWGIHPNFC